MSLRSTALPMALQAITAFHILALVVICSAVVKSNRVNSYNIKPPVQATPFPKSFKCFTCERARDNHNCNIWAEDKWCPENTQFCMSIHHFHSHHGKTKFVTKRCAVQEECRLSGCRHHKETGHTECVSCCEGMICNDEVPTNHTNAVFAVRRIPLGSAPCQTTRPWKAVILMLGLCGWFIL
ncbi:unnamed protein product [Merluccius merluccius]